MSRLEKAMENKEKSKKKSRKIMAAVLALLVIIALASFIFFDDVTGLFDQNDADLIDMARSAAFIDVFGLTYVRVYLNNGKTAAEVTANGEQLRYRSEHDRWELVMSDLEAGDVLQIVIISGEDESVTQKAIIIAEEL